MPPAERDLRSGLALAMQLVGAGQGTVRRVSMIGSRARGDPGPGSDLDVVVVVELPPTARPWTTADALAERHRFQEAVPPPPVRTDLWVCTTDLFEEGRQVVGGVESLVECEGVDLYLRGYDRPATVRRSFEEVRRANVRSWLELGLAAYRSAVGFDHSLPESMRGVVAMPAASQAAWKSARATINALLVSHQLRTAKHDPLGAVLEKLEPAEPVVVSWLRACLPGDACAPSTAGTILEVAVQRLSQDPAMVPLISPVLSRLSRIRQSDHE